MQISKSSNWSVGAFWIQDSSDNPLNPSRGSSSQIAYRVRRLHSPSRWSNALEADHTHFLNLGKRWVLAAGAHLRSLAEEDSSAYLQYGMGGYNSLRGYREEEFSSWRLGWGNLELRWRLAANSRLYLFYDHGVLMRGGDELDARLFAPGLGIKVGSRLGVLSIEYGLGFRDKAFPSFTSGMIHAGLDTSF
jgi:outer membrane protein assembly factor BamA